jgi:hypothetical protein
VDFDRVAGHPDVELLKPLFEDFLEFAEELADLRRVRHINKNSDKFVAVDLALLAPDTANDLGL